ncbi:MAG: RDD family protein [Janthinobacterium lividum]
MSTIRVHTTQNVTLEYEIASIGDRIVAALIDYALYLAWAIAMAILNSNVPLDEIFVWLAVLPTVFYMLVCEIFFNGQTLGKKARNIRVMRLDGTAARLGDYFLRWLLRPFEIVMFLGGLATVVIVANGKGQRIGDLLAGTTVLRQRAAAALLVADQALPLDYQPVFPQAAQLSDHDVALLRQLLDRSVRRDQYVLLNETANKVKQLLHVETSLSDEPFLRTILRDHAHLLMMEG